MRRHAAVALYQRVLRPKQPRLLIRRPVQAHLIYQKLPRKIAHIHIISHVARVAQPQQPLVDDVKQLGNVLERARLVAVHNELLPLEAGVQVEAAQLFVAVAGRLGAEEKALGQDEGLELLDAGNLAAGLDGVGPL